jgi:hypothetical protein
MWVIRGGNLMGDEILLHQLVKNPVAKVRTSITDDRSRCTKPGENSVLQKLDHNSVVIGLARNRLHPLGHIVYSNQNVQKLEGVWEGPMKSMPHTSKISTINTGLRGIIFLFEILSSF